MGLEETELADLLRRYPAGSEVGDATGFELDADIGDVGLAGEDGEADGADFSDGGVGEGEDDVEVVDHEVQDDVDVEGAWGKDAEAVRLEEHGVVELGDGCSDGGVEAFEMADGDDALMGVGEIEDAVGFGEGSGEGLFDEEVEVGEQELLGDRGMVDGGDADGCGVEGEMRGEEFGDRREGGDVVGGGEGGATCVVGLDESGELNELRVSLFEFAIDTEMIAPEGAGADDSYAQRRHGYFFAVVSGSGASTASRQRA